MADFTQFKNRMVAQGRVDFDHQYGFQCVDLNREWWYENGITNTGGNPTAVSYWTHPPQALTNACDRLETSEAHAGDTVILRTNGTSPGDFSGDGHIGIATGNLSANQVEILEQHGAGGNADGLGGNAIRTRWVDRARVAGIYRLKAQVAAAPVVTAPPAVSVPSNKYVFLPPSVATWTAYHVGSALRKGTSDVAGTLAPAKFGGLRYPIEGWISDKAVIITTQSFGQVAIWVKDTDAQYVDDAPTPPPPAPAPEAPKSVYTYERLPSPLYVQAKPNVNLWDLNYAGGYGNAKSLATLSTDPANPNRFTAVGKATKQDLPDHPVYFMSAESFGDADKTGVPAYNQGVNTVDLEPAPAPVEAPPITPENPPLPTATHDGSEKIEVKVKPPNPDAWKGTFKKNFAGDYTAKASTTIHDLEDPTNSAKDRHLVKGDTVHVAEKGTGPDGLEYYRTVKSVAEGAWRGIPVACLDEDETIFTYMDDVIEDFKDITGRISRRRKAILTTAKVHGEINWLADRLKKKGKTT